MKLTLSLAHPNVGSASLALLADVVARRARCIGPRVELSPYPPSFGGDEKRRLVVETSGVRDALRLLDQTSGGVADMEKTEVKRRKLSD